MCMVSMIYEQMKPAIPQLLPWVPEPDTFRPLEPTKPDMDLDRLVKDFRDAVEIAKRIDFLTKQPDCEDPEKAKLERRVAELEKLLADGVEFVIATGASLDPGKYRVVDGKLYRQVDNT